MEIGTEISHKIRSAIKAKLVELGAYVDEELPDYIMVMVANKKTLKQMTSDLELFLAAKTEVFTTWLHELLKKLQSIGTEPKPEAKVVKHKAKKRHSKDTQDGGDDSSKQRKLENEDQEKSTDPEVSTQSEGDQISKNLPEDSKDPPPVFQDTADKDDELDLTDPPSDQTDIKESLLEVTEKAPATSEPTDGQNVSQPPEQTVVEEVEDEAIEPELLVRDDTDEFNEELQIEEARAAKTVEPLKRTHAESAKHSSESTRIAVVKKPTIIPTREIIDSSSRSDKRSITSRLGAKPRAVASPIKQTVVSSRQVSVGSRRYGGGPTSIVGNVIQKPEEEDEEYDPLNPAVGSVASVVKVTARKSSVPRSLQANKSLLLRAVSEAEKSITIKKAGVAKPSTSQMVVRPIRRSEPERTYQPNVEQPKLELTSKSRQDDLMRRMKYTIDNEPPKYSLDPEPVYRVDSDTVKYVVQSESREPQYVIRKEEVYQPVYISQPVIRPSDNRVVEYIPQPIVMIKEEPDSDSDVVEITPPEHQPTPILVDDKEEYEVEKPVYIPVRKVKGRPQMAPKFVVTLDGIDLDKFDDEDRDAAYAEPPTMTAPVQEWTNKVNPPKVKPFNINLKDSDEEEGEEDEEQTPLNQAKATERCKFWPACINGNSCQYHHPTLPCKTFPHCKFSEKCLYIHPNCKYDAKCTRLDCPYTHAIRRTPAAGYPQVVALPPHQVVVATPPYQQAQQSVYQQAAPSGPGGKVQCLYYPNCTNMNCSFYHPIPCRFGVKCKNRFCTYFHPALPSKDKLKWSAQKSTTQFQDKSQLPTSSLS